MKRKILKKVLAVILSASMILGTGIVALAEGEGGGDIPPEFETHDHSWGEPYYSYDNDGHWLQRNCTKDECYIIQYSPDASWSSTALAAGSFAPIAHTYTNGKCICGYECSHDSWDIETGKCTTCGYECPHNGSWINEDGSYCKCSVCGYKRNHTGGTATCTHKPICERCNTSYGETNSSRHEYSNSWVANGAEGHRKIATCGHEGVEVIEYSHTFDTSTHKCTECGYACAHPSNPDDCSICGYKKPVAPAPVETKEETKKENTVTVTPSVVATPASVTPTTLSITPSVENALVKASSNATPVFINMTTASVIPETIVEKLSVTNASVNLTISKDTVIGISKSTLNGTVAAPIVVKTVEPKGIGSLLETTVNIPKDKKLIVMSPVKGATTSNTAVIYQNYGAEMAGKVVNFYVADPTGKFRLYTSAVVYPNGYAAFVVPVVGFVGYAE